MSLNLVGPVGDVKPDHRAAGLRPCAHLPGVLGAMVEARKAPNFGKVVATGVATQDEERAVGPWLFFSELGETPTRQDAQRYYKSALRAIRRNLGRRACRLTPGSRGLRHTYGNGLVSLGVSPAYVQAQMSHASIQQTVDTWLVVPAASAVP